MLTDCMLFGMLIDKRNSAMLSYLVGVEDPVMEWLECLLAPVRVLLDL